jgi:hypothetical protein
VSDEYVPMPETAHPFYESQAPGIRRLLESSRYAIEVFTPRRVSVSFTATTPIAADLDMPRKTLTIKKCAGPAPFIGDPVWEQGWYVWRVAMDDLGRHVAGEARLDISWRSARSAS